MTTEVLIGGVFLLANLIILGLNLKLYTEYFKDMSQKRRVFQGYEPEAESAMSNTSRDVDAGVTDDLTGGQLASSATPHPVRSVLPPL